MANHTSKNVRTVIDKNKSEDINNGNNNILTGYHGEITQQLKDKGQW